MCSTTERSRSPYCCRSHATVASRNRGQSWRCSAGRGHHPSRQGEAIGAQLAPLGVLAAVGPVVGQLRGLCRGAAVQHLGRQGLGHVGQASGSRMASAAISRADHLRGLAVLLGAMARVCLDVQELEAHGSSVAGLFS